MCVTAVDMKDYFQVGSACSFCVYVSTVRMHSPVSNVSN